jgi:non-reducing end alpha-L-arabinofuranosidase
MQLEMSQMKKTRALIVVSFAAVAVGAAIASCTSFSSGDNGGLGGAGGDTTGGTGGMTTTGQGGTPDTGAGGSNNPGTGGSNTGGSNNPGTGGSGGAQPGTGGRPAGTGGTPAGMGGATGMGGAVASNLPCDILAAAGNACAAAHSTTRLLNSKYTGPLYQVCKGATQAGPNSCLGGAAAMKDIPQINGYADAATQDAFCTGAVCTFYTIYDQSGNGNLLRPSPRGGNGPANNPAVATALKINLNGHPVYGVYIRRGQGYRAGCTQCAIVTPKGTATGDQPETEYMVTSQKGLIDGCCFDYGNAETSSNDDGNGTMEAVYFGGGVVWGTGAEGGHSDATNPWVMGDLENGLFAGFSTTNPSNAQRITSNTALHFDYVTALLIGDTAAQNSGQGRFAIYGGNAAAGTLKVMYDGIRPTLGGYVPMKKFGSIILGTGGDNSNTAEGQWFEGVMASGAATLATVNALQANIVAAKYGQ